MAVLLGTPGVRLPSLVTYWKEVGTWEVLFGK